MPQAAPESEGDAARAAAAEAALLRPAEELLLALQRLAAAWPGRPLRALVAGVDWQPAVCPPPRSSPLSFALRPARLLPNMRKQQTARQRHAIKAAACFLCRSTLSGVQKSKCSFSPPVLPVSHPCSA